MIIKTSKENGKEKVTLIDEALIGKKLTEEITISKEEYGTETTTEEEAGDLIRNAEIIELIGEKSVEIGKKEGLVEPDEIEKIDGTPYAKTDNE